LGRPTAAPAWLINHTATRLATRGVPSLAISLDKLAGWDERSNAVMSVSSSATEHVRMVAKGVGPDAERFGGAIAPLALMSLFTTLIVRFSDMNVKRER
jgi:hypothetical protein